METFDLLSAGQFENLDSRGGYGFYLFPKMVPRSWYQDPGTKILVPRSWYQDPGTRISASKKTESLRGGASQKLSRGARGAAGSMPGGLWAGSPPGTAGGLGGGSPPVKTI